MSARRWLVFVGAALVIAAAWFALSRFVGGPQDVAELLRQALRRPLGVVWVPLGIAAGLLVFIPVTALFVGAALVFPPWQAFGLALTGALLGAAGNWVVGRLVAGPLLERLNGEKWQKLTRQLQEHPFRATVVMRFFPIGGFTLLNMFAGAVRVPFGGYLLGNLAGLIPGLALITFLGGRLPDVIRAPSPLQVTLLVGGAAVLVGLTLLVRRWVRPAA